MLVSSSSCNIVLDDSLLFNLMINGKALQYMCRAMDKYVEKWPGGHPHEQEDLKEIQ